MPNRVVIVRSNPISPDPRVEKLARALFGEGYRVTVLGWDRTISLPREQARDFGTLELLPIRAPFGRGLGNLPQLLRWQWGLLRWLLRNRRSMAVIHACDFDTILPSLLVGKLFRKKIVYDIFDFYADHLRNTPRWVRWLIRRVDLFVVGRVDAVILADESRRLQIRTAKPRRVSIICNTPQDVLAKHPHPHKAEMPSSPQHIAQERKPSFRIVYVGLMNVERGLLDLQEVMRRHPDWSLDLAGFGGDEQVIVSKAKDVSGITFHGRVPYERAMELMRSADALVALYDPSIANHRFASPNKLFEALMLAIPIVVAADTNMDRIVAEEGCGLVVTYGDVSGLENALAALASDPAMRKRLGAAGRKAYTRKYRWEFMRQRLVNLYEEIETP